MIIFLANLLAPIISVILFVPQARLVWIQREQPEALKSVSKGTQWLLILNALCWFVIAYDTQNFAVGFPGLINLPMAVFILFLKRRSEKEPASLHRKAN